MSADSSQDHDADVVCCDDCGRWQHVECHDRQDAVEGRRKRNWDKVDFKVSESIRYSDGADKK